MYYRGNVIPANLGQKKSQYNDTDERYRRSSHRDGRRSFVVKDGVSIGSRLGYELLPVL
jgi:hypothetical protein